MLIQFIGPDRTAKTTIAQIISKLLNISYYRNNNTKEYFKNNEIDLSVEYESRFFIDYLKQVPTNLIMDRGIACHFSYSLALDRQFNENFIWQIDEEFSKLKLKLIYCFKKEYKIYIDDVINQNKIKLIKQYYIEFLKKTKCEYLILDTTDENLENQILKIKEFIGE
jgi:thymidylate kinase